MLCLCSYAGLLVFPQKSQTVIHQYWGCCRLNTVRISSEVELDGNKKTHRIMTQILPPPPPPRLIMPTWWWVSRTRFPGVLWSNFIPYGSHLLLPVHRCLQHTRIYDNCQDIMPDIASLFYLQFCFKAVLLVEVNEIVPQHLPLSKKCSLTTDYQAKK